MKLQTITIITKKKEQYINITPLINEFIAQEGHRSGTITVFVPHTTAAVTINESADPDVVEDILHCLDKMVPDNDNYKHFEGNSSAHIKALLTGSSLSLPVSDKKLLLGTWQGVFFCEYDGPRNRSIHLING